MSEAKIRAKMALVLRQTIEEDKFFSFHDFSIEQDSPSYGGKTTKVVYLHTPATYITVSLPTSLSRDKDSETSYYAFGGTHCPGEIDVTESYSTRNLAGFLAVLKKWLRLIKEDLESTPLMRTLEQQQLQIDEIVQAFDSLDGSYFTREEAEQLYKRLDELEKRLEANVRASADASVSAAKHKEDVERRVAEIEKEFDGLKRQVTALPKTSWLKTFLGRFMAWSADPRNQKLLESGVNTVNALLGPHVTGRSDHSE